jgi:hypothetical protein
VEHLAPPLIVTAVFAWLAFDNWVDSRAATARKESEIEGQKLALETQKMEFEAWKLLLEKCQNNEEVSRFLSTDAGKRFVERMQACAVEPPVNNGTNLGSILALIVFGALAMGLGTGFYLLSKFTTHTNFIVPAFLVAIPGLGLLIGAAVSYHLKKKWGLLKREPAAPSV